MEQLSDLGDGHGDRQTPLVSRDYSYLLLRDELWDLSSVEYFAVGILVLVLLESNPMLVDGDRTRDHAALSLMSSGIVEDQPGNDQAFV